MDSCVEAGGGPFSLRARGSFVQGTGASRQLHVKMPRARCLAHAASRRCRGPIILPLAARPKFRAATLPILPTPTPRPKNRSRSSRTETPLRVLSLHTKLWEKVPGQPRIGESVSTRRHRSRAVSSLFPDPLRALRRIHPTAPFLLHPGSRPLTKDEDTSPSGARFRLLRAGLKLGRCWETAQASVVAGLPAAVLGFVRREDSYAIAFPVRHGVEVTRWGLFLVRGVHIFSRVCRLLTTGFPACLGSVKRARPNTSAFI